MRVLVTGAGGFVGRQAVAALARGGHEVLASTRTGTGPLAADLLADGAAERLVASAGADALLHLAWDVSPGYERSPLNRRLADASAALLGAFAERGGRRAVLCGSCLEYDPARAATDPLREDAPLVGGEAKPYALAKAELSERAKAIAADAGVALAWARPFFLFGPGERPGRLVSDAIRAALAGRELVVRAPALVRDYLSVERGGAALAALVESPVVGPVNVASGSGVALGDLARAAARAAGEERLVRCEDGGGDERLASREDGAVVDPAGPPPRLVADVCRLREEVGFDPHEDLDAALAATASWWRERL